MKSPSPTFLTVAGLLIGVVFTGSAGLDAQVTEEAVKRHTEKLQSWLLETQRDDGSWPYSRYPTGMTALALLALKHSGLDNDHPAIVDAVRYVVDNFEAFVYTESLVICALELVDRRKYRQRMNQSLKFLLKAQNAKGWTYSTGRGRYDNSNTQFAVLAFAAAERCGLEVPKTAKRRVLSHWLRSQKSNGGWSYSRSLRDHTYLAMTCAGIASLVLLGREYEVPSGECGEYETDKVIEKGLRRLVQEANGSQPFASPTWRAYTLYALERVGMFLDLKEFGNLDWYRWGAEHALRGADRHDLPSVAFDLLFLAKGEAQIGIAKWHWNGDWNNDHADVRNWVKSAGEKLDLKLDWLPARLDDPEEPAAKASMIFVSGHERFQANAEEARFLHAFLARRGTLVAEGCCNSRPFIDGFREFVTKELYPDGDVEFATIPAEHPICRTPHLLDPSQVSALQAKTGCNRKRIIILTRDISCALNGEPCTPVEKDRAYKVATNILAWAVRSKVPEDRLADVDWTVPGDEDDPFGEDAMFRAPAGKSLEFRQPFGRLVHRGEWDVDLSFFPTLRSELKRHEGAPQFDGEVFVHPNSEDLFASAVVYVTGHGDPRLTQSERRPLRRYLQNGGTILACACCGESRFDRGFRSLLKQLLPNDTLEPVPRSDPLWSKPIDLLAEPVAATREFHRQHGREMGPLLGIRREGRWIVLYSPVDLCCDLEGDLDASTCAYERGTAVKLWINMLHDVFSP